MFRKLNFNKKETLKIEYEVPNLSEENSDESQHSSQSVKSEDSERKANMKKINELQKFTHNKGRINGKGTHISSDSEENSEVSFSDTETEFNTKPKNNCKEEKEINHKIKKKVEISKNEKNDESRKVSRVDNFANPENIPKIEKYQKNEKIPSNEQILNIETHRQVENDSKQTVLSTLCIVDFPKMLVHFNKMEEIKKNIVTPIDRINKDINELKDTNYPLYKFKLLIFLLLNAVGQIKDINVFQDYMYLRRIGLTPEKLSNITDEELSRLFIKKIMNKHPVEKLRDIAQKVHYDYNGDIPENYSELNTLISSNNSSCKRTATKYIKLLNNEEENEIVINTEVSRLSSRLRWSNEETYDKLKVALQDKFPEFMWNKINPVLTAFGQDICIGSNPHCFRCPFTTDCKYFNRSQDKSSEENYHPRFTRLMGYQNKKKIMRESGLLNSVDENEQQDLKLENTEENNKSGGNEKFENSSKNMKKYKPLKRKAIQDSKENVLKKTKK